MLPESIETEFGEAESENTETQATMRAEDIIKPLEEPAPEFDFWEDLKDSLPPWTDEVAGFALFVFGILSFISLYFPAEAMVAVAWSDILTTLFGDGSVFVAVALFGFGVLLWLPKLGIRLRFTALGLLALEIAFLAALAILHLSNSDIELRALARAGQGGGLIGWGLSYPFFLIIGRSASLVLFVIIVALATVVILGLKRCHIVETLDRLALFLQTLGAQSAQPRQRQQQEESLQLYAQLASTGPYRAQFMHIRPDPAKLDEAALQDRQSSIPASTEPVQQSGERDAPADSERLTIGDEPELETQTSNGNVATSDADESRDSITPLESPVATREGVDESVARERYKLPSLELLESAALVMPNEDEVRQNVKLIENTLLEFDIEIKIVDVEVGPTVTRYLLQPHRPDGSERIRMSKIASYSRDLSLALAAKRLRMETPVPGTNYMGIEAPNKQMSAVTMRNVMESENYCRQRAGSQSPLLIPLGRDVAGNPVVTDLAQMPHLLIAGATGSGKSVCMAAIATSLLMQNPPSRLRMIMLDPKMVELSRFNGIPHLLGPVEIDHDRIIGVLRWCTREMDRRYKVLEKHSVRHIDAYNARLPQNPETRPLPHLVLMIDEIGDLMASNPVETESSIARLAQMARAVGMHMVVATQRPSVDVITGLIKANFPSRIAFSVASSADSRVILDKTGAENLLGKGDMLFLAADAAAPRRVQGCFVSEENVRAVVEHWQSQAKNASELDSTPAELDAPWERGLERRKLLADTDPMLEKVIELVAGSHEISASLIQRRLGLGYPRAARIMDLLEELGVVGEVIPGGRSRKVVIPAGANPLRYILDRHKQDDSSA